MVVFGGFVELVSAFPFSPNALIIKSMFVNLSLFLDHDRVTTSQGYITVLIK